MKIILYSNANKIHFCFKGFLLSLVFKVRVSGTPKWPNNLGCTCLTFLPCSSVDVKHDHWSTSMCLTPDTSELWVTAATLKMREKYKNKRYAYLSSRIEVSGNVYCRFLSLNSKTFTAIASLNCLKQVKSDESTPRIIQSLLVHWSQTNLRIASHAHVLGGSSRVPAPLRARDKPLLTSAWETNPTTHLSIKPR